FSQAADGRRDFHVTGVQTCALPISGEDDDLLPESVDRVGLAVLELLGEPETVPPSGEAVGDGLRLDGADCVRVGCGHQDHPFNDGGVIRTVGRRSLPRSASPAGRDALPPGGPAAWCPSMAGLGWPRSTETGAGG